MNAALHRESENWVKTIDEGKGYAAVEPHVFKKILARISQYVIYDAVIKHTRPGQSVLEAGCGWAVSSFALAEQGRSVTALDISEKLISNLQDLQRTLGEPFTKNLTLVVGDIFRLADLNKTFDVLFSDGTYEHFLQDDDRRKIVQQMKAILRLNGLLLVAVPNLKNPFFGSVVDQKMPAMHVFTLRSLVKELEEGGFHVIETGYSFVNPGFEQWAKSRWMISIIRLADAVFPFLPRFLKSMCAAHFYCVARKVT